MTRQRPCPLPEEVAAFLERRLAVAEQLQMESHLAGCEVCAELVADAIRTLGDLPERIPVHAPAGHPVEHATRPQENIVWTSRRPDRVSRRGRIERAPWGALAAAATIVAMLGAPSVLSRLQPRDAELANLADAVGSRRLVEGRLTGGFPHTPLVAPLAGGQGGAAVETVRLELAAGRIRGDLERRSTPERLHALGISQLLLG